MKANRTELLYGLFAAVSLLWTASVSAQTTHTFDVPVDGGGTVRVEADYRARVDIPAPAERPVSRRALITVEDGTENGRLKNLTAVVRNRVAAGTAGGPLELIVADDMVATDRDTAQRPPLRQAQQLGADYLVTVSLDRVERAEKRLVRPGAAPIVNAVFMLAGSYRVTDAYTGATLKGGTCTASRTQRVSSGVEIDGDPFAETLGETFARNVSESLRVQAGSLRDAEKGARSLVQIEAYACDPTNEPVYLPRYDGISQTLLPTAKAEVGMLVEVDGMTVGTAPCRVPMLPGPHTVRLYRDGFEPVTLQTVPYDGMTLRVGVRMDARQYARVRESILFLQHLTAGAQELAADAAEQEHRHTVERALVPARIKEIEAHAQRLAQSGYRVDIRRDEKVDATALPDVEIRQEYRPGIAPVIPFTVP